MKSMIKGLVEIYPSNWDRCLPFMLWSYRECPVEGLSFSSFELLFGRSPSGPLALLKDTWLSKPSKEQNTKHVFNYVMELRDKIDKAIEITEKETTVARHKSKEWFDKNALVRELKVGQLVLLYFANRGQTIS